MKKGKKSKYTEIAVGEMRKIQGCGNVDQAVLSKHNFGIMILEKGAGCNAKKS